MELAVALGERGNEADALRLLGEISVAGDPPDFDVAHTSYARATALAEQLGMRPLLARCYLGLGQLYRMTGNRSMAAEHLTTATTMFREMDMRFWLGKAETEKAELG